MEERTISMMVGKGSISHNNRNFIAKNVDKERTGENVVFVQDNLREVYHKLFDRALEEYNQRQARSDRKIDDYYEKIRRGKQEKLFHELIVQIGNRDDCGNRHDERNRTMVILQEYMVGFRERNPNLRVFNAVIHMDEATPHLHIDFVPFSLGNKRGLETRVSLKGALKAQGFAGTGRRDTEWNRWVASEKECLAKIMEQHQVKWNQKGTHEKHLSVYDYEKKMRIQEVRELEQEITEKELTLVGQQSEISFNKQKLARQAVSVEQSQNELERIKKEQQEAECRKEMAYKSLEHWEEMAESARKRYQDYDSMTENARQQYEYANDKQNDMQKRLTFLQEQVSKLEQEKKAKQQSLEDADLKLDILKEMQENAVAEYDSTRNRMEEYVTQAKNMYEKYSRIAVGSRQYEMFEDMVQLSQENERLKDENQTLREKLQQAYDFMKQITIQGKSMLEHFLESIGEKIQEFTETIGFRR